jgi:tRNA(Ile2) C34 agmatinyltransferase TiaS
MKFWRKKKKCPACGSRMSKKGKGYTCPDCGTKIIGDIQIRPKLTWDDETRIWQ